MLAKLFKRKPAFEDSVNAEIEKYFSEYKKYINKIDNLLPSYKDVSYEMFYDILVRFFRKVYDLPASENHHHAERFGLFVHSLETCINALVAQHRKLELKIDSNGDLDSQFNLRNKEKILYRTAIQGLLHDAGKVFDMDIISKKKEIQWDNYDDNLLDFCLINGDYDIKWYKERTGKHEKRNIIILWQILETRDRQYLTAYNFIRLIDEFWGYDPVETTKELIKDADILSVQMDYQESLPKRENKDEVYNIIEAFSASVAEMTDKRILKINEKVSDLIVLDTITLIVNPLAMQKILGYMKKHYQLKTTREHIVKLMRDKKIILETDTGKTFIHALITPPESVNNFKLNFVIIKNKYIWGCNKPENFKGKVRIPDFDIEETDNTSSNKEKSHSEKQPKISQDKNIYLETSKKITEETSGEDKKTAQQKLYEYIKTQKPKKFDIFLKALALTLESETTLQNIEHIKIDNQEYFIIGYKDGFREIAKHTGIFNLKDDEKEQNKAIHGFINSLYDSGHLAKFKEFEEKPLIPVKAKREYEKAILIFKNSIS
ncbi:MAG: hypothetical protein FXF54_12290 [Kosmotoga sp.]|nr:MAG: hypothetical protein FXF54_12290 [Kosmotoga sp.]